MGIRKRDSTNCLVKVGFLKWDRVSSLKSFLRLSVWVSPPPGAPLNICPYTWLRRRWINHCQPRPLAHHPHSPPLHSPLFLSPLLWESAITTIPPREHWESVGCGNLRWCLHKYQRERAARIYSPRACPTAALVGLRLLGGRADSGHVFGSLSRLSPVAAAATSTWLSPKGDERVRKRSASVPEKMVPC